jgi:transketolase
VVPSEVSEYYAQCVTKGNALEEQWDAMFSAYSAAHADLAAALGRRMRGELPADEDWIDKLPGNPAVCCAYAWCTPLSRTLVLFIYMYMYTCIHIYTSFVRLDILSGLSVLAAFYSCTSSRYRNNCTSNYTQAGSKIAATRAHSGEVLNALAEALPELMGGSADLAGSNCTNLKVGHAKFNTQIYFFFSL